jgi:hypothetical protein
MFNLPFYFIIGAILGLLMPNKEVDIDFTLKFNLKKSLLFCFSIFAFIYAPFMIFYAIPNFIISSQSFNFFAKFIVGMYLTGIFCYGIIVLYAKVLMPNIFKLSKNMY